MKNITNIDAGDRVKFTVEVATSVNLRSTVELEGMVCNFPGGWNGLGIVVDGHEFVIDISYALSIEKI